MEYEKEYAVGEIVDGCKVTEINRSLRECSDVCKYKDEPLENCLPIRCTSTRRTDGKDVFFKPLT